MNDSAYAMPGLALPVRERKWDVFISYSREDIIAGVALAGALEARGFTVWHVGKLGADQLVQDIDQALRSSGAVIVLLSATSLSSPWISREMHLASEVLPRDAIHPIAVGELDLRATPPWLATRRWLHLHDVRRVGKLVDQLLPVLNVGPSGRSAEIGSARYRGELPPRTPLIGVEDYLRRLMAQPRGMTVIVGQAGAGKTMLAREYAYQVRDNVDFVWWISCLSRGIEDLERQLRRIEEETNAGERGLVVVDGLGDLKDARRPLKQLATLSQRHRVVVTSQRIEESKLLDVPRSNVLILGPLSLAQIDQYLQMYAPELRSQERGQLAHIADLTEYPIFALRLITQVLRIQPVDALLGVASAPGPMISEMLRLLLGQLSPEERHRLYVLSFCSAFLGDVRNGSPWNLPGDDALLDRLLDWGLCVSGFDRSLAFTEPVGDFLRAQAPRQAFEDALAYLAPRLPDPNEPISQSYLRNITDLTNLAEQDWTPDSAGNLAELLIWQGSVWLASGEPERAEVLGLRALKMATESRQAMLRIRALNLQSALAFHLGRIEEASAIERRTADLAAQEFMPEHPIVIASLANLATSRRVVGDLPEAITLLQHAVELGQRALPQGDPDLMSVQINLAVCLRDAGFADEALALLAEVGLDTADDRVRLQVQQVRAAVLMDKGQLEEAASVLTDALSSSDRAGLSLASDTLTAQANLATVYSKLGLLNEALVLQAEIVEKFDVVYGPDHPATLSARGNYGGLLAETGALADALEKLSDVATRRTRIFGPEHPDTLQSRLRVAITLSALGDSSQALELFSEVMLGVVRVLGPDHPMSFTVREGYARELGRAGDVAGSRRAFRELLADLERTLPPNHPMRQRVAAEIADA